MPLDKALRSALVREGEAIAADVAVALPAIHGRVRAHRRRRALQGAVVALVVALVVWAAPGLRIETMDDGPRPAREPFPPEKLLDRPGQHVESRLAPAQTPATRVGDGRTHRPEPRWRERTRVAGAERGEGRDRAGSRPPSATPTVGVLPRRVLEQYEVAYVQGTHIGENAGTGCTKGGEAMGTNDCFPIQLDDDETEVSLRLVDDDGLVVGATVRQHVNGDSTELVSFCGSTDGYVAVEPGALLLVYLDISDRCSEGRPHSGTLTAFLR